MSPDDEPVRGWAFAGRCAVFLSIVLAPWLALLALVLLWRAA